MTTTSDRQTLMAEEIVEENNRRLLAEWLREGDAEVTPLNMRYRVWCRSTNRVVRDWTEVPNPQAVQIIEIAAQDLAIIDTDNQIELKLIIVQTDYGTASQFQSLVYQPVRRAS